MTLTLALAMAAVGGLLIGSFLNVVAARVPEGESVVVGRSRCPSCRAAISPRDNVPVLSWLILRGKCRSCGTAISRQYPIVELGTAVAFTAITAVHYDDTAALVLGIALAGLLIPIACIDLAVRRIPNELTLFGAVAAVVLGLLVDLDGQPERLLAGTLAALFFGIPALLAPRGMGMGDAKLAGVMGLFLGAAVGPAILIGLLTGVLVGGGIVAAKGMSAGRRTQIPFGPFLGFGAFVAILAGTEILEWYGRAF